MIDEVTATCVFERKNSLRCLRKGNLGITFPIRAVKVKPVLISRRLYLHSSCAAYRNRFPIIVTLIVKQLSTGMKENIISTHTDKGVPISP